MSVGARFCDAFGDVRGMQLAGAEPLSADPPQFGGQWGYFTDATAGTGLVLLGHRYYDPQTGRFLTRDPTGYAGGENLYGFAGDDPVNGEDAWGQDPCNPLDPDYGFTGRPCSEESMRALHPGTQPGTAQNAMARRMAAGLKSTLETAPLAVVGGPEDEAAPGVAEQGSRGALASIGGFFRSVGRRIASWFEANPAPAARWVLPEGGGGAQIGDYWYTEHALERMAPDTPQVRAELEARATARARAVGIAPGTRAWKTWWARNRPDPRGIPPSVVEAEIANPGSTGIMVVRAGNRIITVLPRP